MKYLVMVLVLCLSVVAGAQNNQQSPEQIKQQMAQIRRSTDWDDPVAAQKANEEIKKLSKQLIMAGSQQGNPNPGKPQGQGNSEDMQKQAQLNEEIIDYKMDLISQIAKSASGGGDILLAEPLRKEIVEEYKEDDDKSVKNAEFLDQMSLLVIDMSMPGVEAVINSMPNFKGVKMLIITAGENPVPANFSNILRNASNYPLETIYIINFGLFLNNVPPEIFGFKRLSVLGLFNNNIAEIPEEIANLSALQELYIDMNPVSVLFPWIESLATLKKIGLAKTAISAKETERLKVTIPTCQIL